MRSTRQNILLLTILCMLSASIGGYVTFFQQKEALHRTEEAEKSIALERTELQTLSTLERDIREEIQYAAQRWQARYKNVGDSLSTADVVAYINRFAERGFSALDVEYAGLHTGANHQYYAFQLRGSGPFEHLYEFIWHIENNRDFYRIEDLVVNRSSGGETEQIEFTCRLLAYFGAGPAISAPGIMNVAAVSVATTPDTSSLPLVPSNVLPARRLSIDPFGGDGSVTAPRSDEPRPLNPNTPALRNAKLLSIAGDVAVFDFNGKLKSFRVGDAVREGRIANIDPTRQRVRVDREGAEPIHFAMELEPLHKRFRGDGAYVPIG